MKIKDILAIVAVTLMAVGCSSDDGLQPKQGRVPISLTASINSEVATRGYQEENLVESEKVYVWGKEGTGNYDYLQAWALTAGASGALTGSAKYYPLSGETLTMVALHGNFSYTEGDALPASISHSVELDQSSTGNYEKSDLLWATASGSSANATSKNLAFTHMLSKIEIKLHPGEGYSDISAAEVRLRGVKPTIAFNPTDGSLGEASGTATLIKARKTEDHLSEGSPYAVYEAIIPPQAAPTAFLNIKIGDKVATVAADVDAFASNKRYFYDITITEFRVIVSSTITDWGTDDALGTATQVETAYYTPLTLEAMENDLTVTISNPLTKTIMYSVNGAPRISSSANPISISLPYIGDKVCLYGDNDTYATGYADNQFTHISCDKNFYLYGNIMSLISSSNFASLTTLSATYTFARLFDGDATNGNKLHSLTGKPIVLPATTLQDYCYARLFQYCTELTTPPMLPATTLMTYCYYTMFDGCTSLLRTPKLPAMDAVYGCYTGMFRNCTSLTEAPELPAITVGTSSYSHMFYGCIGLTVAPVLPAATLGNSSYWNMFYGCTNLSYIKMMATSIGNGLQGWVTGVASTGTFVRHANMTTLPTGNDGIPDNWTVETATE